MSPRGTRSFCFYCFIGLELLAALFQGEYAAEECPIFGTKYDTELTLRETRRIVMNFGSPAQCKGNVTGWRFCYYQNGNDTLNYTFGDSVSSTLAVFRSLDSSYSIYEPLRENRKEITISIEDVLNMSNFTCMNVELNPEEYFEVKENDIIGACIRGLNPLILVGNSTGSNSNYRIERGCNLNRNVSTSDLTQLSNSLLHLYVDIAVAASCRAGNNPPPSVAVMSAFSGTYLNTRYPVTCGSHITKWHYCYYTEAATPGSTLSMTVAVWSLDADTNTYIVSPRSIRNITTRPVQTLAKIFCVEELLNENEYLRVSVGDVIGVVLPSNDSIPILGSGADADQYVLKNLEKLCPTNLTRQDFCQLQNSVMHLYAKVDSMMEETVTTAMAKVKVADSSTTTIIEICINESSSGRSVSAGLIFAITVSLLLLIGMLTITIVFMKIKNTRKSSKSNMIDNMVYHLHEENGDKDPTSHQDFPNKKNGISDYPKDIYSTAMEITYYEYEAELDNIKNGNLPVWQENTYDEPADNEEDIYSFLKERKITNISGDSIIVGRELGLGQFGTVYEGQWKQATKKVVDVALKSLNDNTSSTDRLKFLQEAAIMAQFRHPNVAALYGVVEQNGTMMIVVELLPNGDLRHYLHTLRPQSSQPVQSSTPNTLLHFSQQICLGMNYLSTTGFVHRDLAARNILLSSTLICKVADFGMSRDLHEGDYYTSSGGKIPIKWTAPEALHYKKYSTASDVWSYGCVLYEIWSLGHKPFEDRSNAEVLRVIDNGNRMAPPPGCPRRLYQLMITCWSPNPKERPLFRDILISMLENENVVLHIPSDVTDANSQAATLGAPLKTGYQMYKDLQTTYS